MQQRGCYYKMVATEWLLLHANRVVVIAKRTQQSGFHCKQDATEWLLLQTE